MILSEVRDGLATRLNTISGLRVHEVGPEAVSEFPAAIISQEEPFIKYDQVMGAADVRYAFKVVLLVSSGDRQQAWADLEPLPVRERRIVAEVGGGRHVGRQRRLGPGGAS